MGNTNPIILGINYNERNKATSALELKTYSEFVLELRTILVYFYIKRINTLIFIGLNQGGCCMNGKMDALVKKL